MSLVIRKRLQFASVQATPARIATLARGEALDYIALSQHLRSGLRVKREWGPGGTRSFLFYPACRTRADKPFERYAGLGRPFFVGIRRAAG